MKTDNEFGAQTYWNCPTGRQRTLTSKYASLNLKSKAKPKAKVAKANSSRSPTPTENKRPPRSTSPTPSTASSVITVVSPHRSAYAVMHKSKEEENDDKDEKSIFKIMKSKLPQFSNEADWEMAIFELGLILDRVWTHADELDIVDYSSFSGDMGTRADRLIYFALTMASKKNSFAKLQIMASCHKDAVPCFMKNEGKNCIKCSRLCFP